MHKRKALSAAISGVLLSAALAPGSALYAQDATVDDVEEIEEIITTGTRVVNPNLEQASQILVLDEEEMLSRQALDAESLVGELPGIAPGLSRSINNGSGGWAALNLRGLGSNRNLILLDGQRIVPTNLSAVTDLNVIPMSMIERVDIVTGGASSVYGADAVAGVSNFITKRNFSGIELSATTGATMDNDSGSTRFDITLGGDIDGGKGNVAVNVGYQEVDGLLQGEREYSKVATFGTLPLGSGTSRPTRINGQMYDPATGGVQPSTTYNYAPFNYFQTPLERYNIYAKAHYEAAPGIEVYTNAMYSRIKVDLQLAPSGMFGDTWIMPLNNPFLTDDFRNLICDNPLNAIPTATCDLAGAAANSADPDYLEVPVVVNRRLIEQGNRETEYLTDMFQVTVGTRGDISENWSFDVFGQYGESSRAQTNNNWGLKSLLQQTLFATDATTCDPTKNPGVGCVPINLFGNGEDISEGTIAYWNKPNGTTVKTTLTAAIASVSGEFDMPGFMPTDLPLGIAGGFEYRKYEASQNADVAASTQDEVLGTGSPDPLFSGTYDASEFFVEAIMPLVTGKTAMESLTLELGARQSDYSTSGSATTWKAGMSYEPVDGVKIRGIFQESSRSPNIFELFNPPTTGLNNLIFDPCQGMLADGVTPNPALGNADIRAICAAQGAPQVAIDNGIIPPPSANQINETSGGNVNLDVETAESTTFGFVITPDPIPALTVTLDYYNIKITDAITTPTAGDIFGPCFGDGTAGSTFPGADPSSPSCALIGRNPLNGSLNGGGDTLGLITQYTNQGTLETSGIDMRVTYDWELNAGVFQSLMFDLTYNHTMESLFQAGPNSINRECVGQYSENCDPNIPKNSFNFRTTAGLGEFGDVTLLWRWADQLDYEKILDNPFEGSGLGGVNDTEFLNMKAASYFDLGYAKTFADMFTVRLLVSNLFDESPPIVGSFLGGTGWNSGNTYPSSYDVLGRRWNLTASVRFE